MKGSVVLMKKNIMDLNDVNSSIVDGIDESLGKKISFQLVSLNHPDPTRDGKGKLGKPSYLEKWQEKNSGLIASDLAFEISFDWDDEVGAPGAVIVRNEHHSEFYLRSFTLGDVPGQKSTIQFVCNSWVYPTDRYKRDRLFFTNQAFRPEETPQSLRKYREEELEILRGSGEGELKEWDRVYDYAYYNDLGDPDKGPGFARPVLGGSPEYPFPRRGRTSRPPTTTDSKTESRLPIAKSIGVYVPRDERFGHLKLSDFLGYVLKSVAQDYIAGIFNKVHENPLEFSSFQDELDLYAGGMEFPDGFETTWESIPFEFLKAFLQNDGSPFLKYPVPQIIKEDNLAWRSDEEFAREMLAGMHPLMIRLLEDFPPKSKLDPDKYGNQNSTITNTDIEKNLDGLISVEEAMKMKKLFILEHHDALMPFLRKINTTLSKVYATRTILFLKKDGTLKPLAIELSLPHADGDKSGSVSKVFTPAQLGIEGSIWNLAKAYVVVNDQSCHQLYSHWALTHMVVEPFVIATHRQLSVVHPIYKLLKPHFKDTMFINAIGRQSLLNAEGALEQTLFHGHYSMGWASSMYRDWVFSDQALPRDLLKRGMASENSQSPFGYKLVIEDYPYAVDGLEIWFAIETWVRDYSSYYYESDERIATDIELQSWWKEIREEGHGDKKDEKWWPEIKTLNELIETCTTIIWISSALHSALNFGQYPYGGFHPNRPTVSRQFMPEPGTPEYAELLINPDKVFLKTISNQLQTLLGLATIEILSRHASDEVYLGGGNPEEYILDAVPLGAYNRFRKKLLDVEFNITARNANEKLKNRAGPVKVPYTLLCPTSGIGLTGRGISNSISI